ncbi:MAG: hypothetical protein IJI71_05775 [Clostridia bacterium]|nr:hypothetical protein [Clostridia bacterium]
MKRISLFLAMALLLAVVPMGALAEAIAPDGLDLAQDLEAADEAIELPGLALDVPDPVSEAIPAPQDEAAENAGDVAINKANFPDKAFRAYVKENVDTDGNGKLTRAERKAVEELYVTNMGITDLDKDTGYFRLLKTGTVTVTASSGGKKAKIKVIVK